MKSDLQVVLEIVTGLVLGLIALYWFSGLSKDEMDMVTWILLI